jgi:hypothetical protein
MGSEWNNGRHDASEPDRDSVDELERQAREAMALIRQQWGGLGARVRRAVERAGTHWDASLPPVSASTSEVAPAHEARARTLVRRWVAIDFLVDPDLPASMSVLSLEQGAIWRAEVRERGETRLIEERHEPYRGVQHQPTQPVLPPWDYQVPHMPEVEAGERHMRLPGTESVRACRSCNGTGQRACHHCEGRGFVTCPRCRGRARLTCPRCRGRGRVTDAAAERRARAGTPYLQVHAERLAAEAGERVADLAERLRQEWGVPLPPSRDWMPVAPASGQTIPCPECLDGSVPCECGNGKRACATCEGSRHQECHMCGGTGRVVRHRELVRRFDTRISRRALPVEERVVAWAPQDALARGTGERVWEESLEEALARPAAPPAVPPAIWQAALAFAGVALPAEEPPSSVSHGERRPIARQLALVRVPLTRVQYAFAGHQYTVVALGAPDAERFWAETFPPRWSRVGRFLRAVSRDLGELGAGSAPDQSPGRVSALDEYRVRRAGAVPDSGAAPTPEITSTPPGDQTSE